MTEGLRSEVRDGVATLTLDRPAVMNALTIPVKEALLEALRAIHADRSVRAVVLTGTGRAFCAGQDLVERESPDAPPLDEELRDRYEPIVRSMIGLDRPILAAINGVAAGAGTSLALAADVRIAAASARFVLAFGRIGLVPDSGATWLLPRIVGSSRAAELALLGTTLDAEAALAAGLVSRVVPDEDLAAVAHELAAGMAAMAPQAVAATKRLLMDAWSTDLDGALAAEREAQGRLGGSRDHAEGLAAFRDKRPPRFTGE